MVETVEKWDAARNIWIDPDPTPVEQVELTVTQKKMLNMFMGRAPMTSITGKVIRAHLLRNPRDAPKFADLFVSVIFG